jgi:hypothetical protein
MIYYRLASQKNHSTEWEWKSESVDSLEALLRLGRQYGFMPTEQLRVFMASSHAYMDVLLVRENLGLSSNSVTLDQLLQGSEDISTSSIHGLEQELGWQERADMVQSEQSVQVAEAPVAVEHDHEPGGGDHDTPYTFTFPTLLPQARAWIRLRERVQAGELVS